MVMRVFDHVPANNLDQRESHLIFFACLTIIILAAGLAVFMYPIVYSQPHVASNRTMPYFFFGFCALAVLLALYLLDRQAMIRRLRQQIAEERRTASEALMKASAELLDTLPTYSTFQDGLTMEYRREFTTKQNLSVLVIMIKVSEASSESSLNLSVLGDAAKAISRKLRAQDSIDLLASSHFGIILPGLDAAAARRISLRLAEGLTDAAGANSRFSFKVDAISYPEQVSSAHDLELAIKNLIPEDNLNHAARVALASK
jgi:GGDEF domain-containing protein